MSLLVADFNGTLVRYPTDEVQNKPIANAVVDSYLRHLRLDRVAALYFVHRNQLKRRIADYERTKAPETLKGVYEYFSEHVLRGQDPELVRGAMDAYAEEAAAQVDHAMLRPLKGAFLNGMDMAILSTSVDYSIERILQRAGYGDLFNSHRIIAHRMSQNAFNHTLHGFTSDKYGKKPELLRSHMKSKRAVPERTLFTGDSMEEDAAVVTSGVIPGRNFIVPFFATDDFKNYMALAHDAFVPEDEGDLGRYLELNLKP